MISTLISAIATLSAAFGGAYVAFLLNDRNKEKLQYEKNVQGVNQVLFVLFQQANTLLLYQHDFLNPVRDEAGRHVALRPTMPGQLQCTRIPFELIDFLATPKHAQVLFDVAIEQERFNTAIRSIQVQSDLQLKEVQPRLAGAGVRDGEDVTGEQVEAALGDMLHTYLRETTDQVYYHVDKTINSLEQVKDQLRKTVKEVYPEAQIIDFVPVVDTQQGNAADR